MNYYVVFVSFYFFFTAFVVPFVKYNIRKTGNKEDQINFVEKNVGTSCLLA
jgi:hypothetical protein